MEQAVQNSPDISLCEIIQKGIGEYLINDYNTISKISHYTGLNFRTIKKLGEGETDWRKQDPFKVAKLVKLIDKSYASIQDVLNSFNNLKEEALKVEFSSLTGTENPINKKENDEFREMFGIHANDPEKVHLIMMCSHEGGAAESDLYDAIGGRYESILNELIEDNLIVKSRGRFNLNIGDKNVHISRYDLKNYFNTFLKYYKPENAGTQTNSIYYVSENLNEKGIAAAHAIVRKFTKEMYEVMADKSNMGETPYFNAMVLDSFTSSKKEVLQ